MQSQQPCPDAVQIDLTPGPIASPALWFVVAVGSLISVWQFYRGMTIHDGALGAHFSGALLAAILAFVPLWLMSRYRLRPTRLTLSTDALCYQPSLGKSRKLPWALVDKVRVGSFRGSATITITSDKATSPFRIGWLSAGHPKPKTLVSIIESYSQNLKAGEANNFALQEIAAETRQNRRGIHWGFWIPIVGKILVYFGGPILVVVVALQPPHDPYAKPERSFAAPAAGVPKGCTMVKTRLGDELTRPCDDSQTRIMLPDDFETHLRVERGYEIIRLGNNIYAVNCDKVWPQCSISDSQVNFFFQPTPSQLKDLKAHETRFRGAPVQIGPGLYGYPDMFSTRP